LTAARLAGTMAGEPDVDLRSDTVTRPTDAMREAMAEAEVGNSALGEDPAVDRLEAEAADLFGKADALFLPSGTMANLAAMIAWTRDVERPEIVAESTAHVLLYESSSIARVAHAQARPIEGEAGRMDPGDVRAHIRPAGGPTIKPQTALVCLEQTHNQAGGVALGLEHMDEIAAIADEADVPVHIDGARSLNAAEALDVAPAEIADRGDSIMLALTKGLGAPVGSVLAGSEAFIQRARRAKALVGGGMRQSGHLAAAGLLALQEGPKRLEQDHRRARRLADELAAVEGIEVDLDRVDTNIVFFDVSELGVDAATFAERAAEHGVGFDGMMTEHRVRAVAHRDVDGDDVERAIEVVQTVADEVR
jgi:threonine aldolase